MRRLREKQQGAGAEKGLWPDNLRAIQALGLSESDILAVLRDVFVHDDDVADWLETAHETLDHVAPVDAILAGREAEVVGLAVSTWNEMACAASPA